MDIDKLALISGDPITICDGIVLLQPTLREIKEYGEGEFFSTFWTLCSSPWDIPASLDDMGIDFMEITEWELFQGLLTGCSVEQTSLFFGDLDFTKFTPLSRMKEDGTEEIVLCNSDGVILDDEAHQAMVSYIGTMIGFQHSGKKAGNKITKKLMIDDDRKRKEKDKDKKFESVLFDGILSMVNTEECKYDFHTIFDLTLYQYMKSFTQIQGKKAACALTQGSMSGFMDTSQIDKLEFQWVYSEEKYKPKTKKLVNNKISKK